MHTAVNISGAPKEAVDAFGEKILDILKAGMDYRLTDETIQAALRVLSAGVSVNGTTITGSNFSSNDTWITPDCDDELDDEDD